MDRSFLRDEASQRFNRAWEHECRKHPEWEYQSRDNVALAVLPAVIGMMDREPNRSVHDMRPIIHRMLVEAAFIDECGDPVTCADRGQLNGQARILAEVLDDVVAEHEAAAFDGNLSHMFG